ncbi:hypothetical protein MKX01_023276 [Papaver californicum]|nr:hypothetical protein MKX01_023276 [Papaver californicum]
MTNKHFPGTYFLPLLDPALPALPPGLLHFQFCFGHLSTCSSSPFKPMYLVDLDLSNYGLSPLFCSLDLFPSSPCLSTTFLYADEDHHIPNHPPFLLLTPPTSLPLPEDHHVGQQNPQGTLETTEPSSSLTPIISFNKILLVLANIP